MMIGPVSRSVVFALLAALAVGTGQGSAQADDGWSKIQDLLFSEAVALFRAEQKTSTGSERDSAQLGEALALLNRQPVTRKGLDKVVALLDDLIEQAAPGDTRLQALYLKARVTQMRPFEPDPPAAMLIYQALAHDHPATFLGQTAFLKASALQLYDPATAAEDRPFAAIEQASGFLSNPDAICSYHLMMAEASHRFEYDDAFSLHHYVGAYKAGLTKPDLRANVLTRIIILSHRLGAIEETRAWADEFKQCFPRDIRITVIDEIAAALEATPR